MTQTETYFENLEIEIKRNYKVAESARACGLDPVGKVEVPLAHNLAEKVVSLVSTIYPQVQNKKIVNRILELEKEYGKLDTAVCLKIAEEVAQEKFCKFENQLQAIEAGIRIGFAYTTLGVVSSPIEGFTFLKLGKTLDGRDYFMPYFSGPIRSAGTTASCVALIIIDYLREFFGYAKYDPTEDEIKRTATELFDFHDRITNLQYCPTEEEILFIAENLPIQVSGEPSEKLEASNYKDLPRVDTNFLRSGFCLILAEGVAQKAPKALRLLKGLKEKGFKLSDWDWLEKYCELHEKRQTGDSDNTPTYMKDMVAGRPIFGHPSRSGAFRFRYGRSRVAGFSAVSVHPATMAISDGFLAVGTQLKIEKPTKGCVISVCDDIDGPIVKLKDGSVIQINDLEEAKKLYNDVEEIVYYGDILFPFGDVLNRNSDLIKPGYVEEWWNLEVEKLGGGVSDYRNVSFEKAVELSTKFRLPLYPKYIYFYTQINYEGFLEFLRWFSYARINSGKIMLPYTRIEKEKFEKSKRVLELLGVSHKVGVENVIISEVDSKALFVNLGLDLNLLNEENCFIEKQVNKIAEKAVEFKEKDVLVFINSLSDFIIKDKAGEFIGSRMGRPEKAKLRKLTGNPHGLFPIGEEGGRFRSLNEACKVGKVTAEFPIRFCEKCNKETIYNLCEGCGEKTKKKSYCRECGESFFGDKCKKHNLGVEYSRRVININDYFKDAVKKLGLVSGQVPDLIKGVRGTSSGKHDFEHVAKLILRSKFNLNVNKDGTIRYDMTELPITHFKPKEISVSVEKLKELGYVKDIKDKDLVNDEQILELMPHDIILPCNSESGDEKADDVFVNLTKFIDSLLTDFYKLDSFYNVKKRDDLVGHLSVCMAPHNCAGVISRIIGFSKTQGLLASPYMHAAIRRDCFDYNTFLPIKQNGKWKICKIGELVEEIKPDKLVDNFGTKEKKVKGFETIGVLKDLKEVKINNFTKHKKRLMFEIKTSLGKKIKITENHKFLVNGKIKRASSLKIGDKLPLPIKINIKSKKLEKINLLEELNGENLMVRGIGKILKKVSEFEKEEILRKLKITKKQFQNFKGRDSYPSGFVLSLNDKLKKEIFIKGKIAIKRDNVELPIIINFTD